MSTKSDLLIRNAHVVNEGSIQQADVQVHAGRIIKIAASIDVEATTQIDAQGKYLLPGMIDDQVHFREPGLTHKGNIATESRAAVAGGITSYMEMPNTTPPTLDAEALEAKCESAAQGSLANYAFYLGASNDNLAQVSAIDPNSIAGIKVFMGSSTGNMLVDNPKTLEGIFANAPCLVVTHCEDTPSIISAMKRAQEQFGDNIPPEEHPNIRNADACYKSSSMAVDLAKKHGTALHVLHLTSAKEMALFNPGPIDNKAITAEVCVHHLFFDQNDYATKGNLIKCNPAIKTPDDRTALRQALKEGRLDIIATDHAPHRLSEKQVPYAKAAAGLPLVQDVLNALFTLVDDGVLSLTDLVEKTAHNVAKRYQVHERGYIREGYWADLTLVDTAKPRIVSREQVLSRCGWSPFETQTLAASIESTIVSGYLAYHQGQFHAFRPGMRIAFNR